VSDLFLVRNRLVDEHAPCVARTNSELQEDIRRGTRKSMEPYGLEVSRYTSFLKCRRHEPLIKHSEIKEQQWDNMVKNCKLLGEDATIAPFANFTGDYFDTYKAIYPGPITTAQS
jgi:hypothetical protein